MAAKEIITYQDEFRKEVTVFHLAFSSNDGGGYVFDCDEEGNILFDKLQPLGAENARQCLAGEKPGFGPGKIRSSLLVTTYCSCGSKESPFEVFDAKGIYAGKACSKCEKEKQAKFRPEVFTDPFYETNEPIDEDY